MAKKQAHRLRTISEFHQLRQLAKPEHPLISVISFEDLHRSTYDPENLVLDFYSISLKRNIEGKIRYGQQEYDFDEGLMFFIAPGQVFSVEVNLEAARKITGWLLLIHPDFLWGSPLAQKIRQYAYFSYSVSEALFLSEKEEKTLNYLIENMQQEYHSNLDRFSQEIILSQLELLLNYAERFYQRQFLTRKIASHQALTKLEEWLDAYFNSQDALLKGLPSVQVIAEALHVSPNYLSTLLKVHTGQSTQQHIHEKLIEKAKEKLSATGLSVSEIAYSLGFEHTQSFSKLFKSKTQLTPLEFREKFN